MTIPEAPQHRAKADEIAEFEKDIKSYLGHLERWVDLSPYEKYLGRLREALGQAYFSFGGDREGYQKYRRAAFARIIIVSAFMIAAMLAPMFYDYLPIAAAYGLLNVFLIVLVLFRVASGFAFSILAILDVIVITFTVHLFGSLTSVVVVFFPLLVTLATIFLGFFWGLAYAILTSELYTVVILMEYFGLASYSPLLGHQLPAYNYHGFPTFPFVVILVAHLINYGSAFFTGLLTYELELRRRAAETAMQTKNEMLAVCSHDLKNMLVTVSGYSELLLLQAGTPGTDTTVYAREIHRSTRRMIELIRDLLDSARLEGGTVVLSHSVFSFRELANDVASTQTANAGLRNITLNIPASVTTAKFKGDKSKLSQVFTNLVQNAIFHTPEGGTVTMELSQVVNGKARISVRDNGPGIPPDMQDILFDPMALARRRSQENRKIGNSLSTGIGLSIVKKFVELHGGKVWVESELGKGSTFWVELPVMQ